MPGGAEPLERRQGSVVGAAAHRARVRGEVRPPAGRPLPPRGHLPALAAGQAAGRLPLRPARGHDSVRAREGLRRRRSHEPFQSSLSGSSFGIERFLRGPQRLRHVLQVDADARPGLEAAAHRVDQHVGGLEVRRRVGVPRLPALEAGERVVLRRAAISISGAARRDRRRLRAELDRRSASAALARARRLHARRLAAAASGSAAATARRPGPRARARADSSSSASSEHGCSSIAAWRSPTAAKRAGIVAQREVARVAVVDLVPGQRRRHARVGRRPHRVGAGDGAVLRVLVVVEEDAVALFLPPLAGRERRRAPLDLARERQRGAAHLGRTSSGARCARRRGCRASPTSSASRRGRDRRASRARRARPRAPAATRRRAPDRDRRAARRDDRDRRRAPDADAARGRRGWPSTRAPRRRAARLPRRCGPTETAARRPRSTSGRDSGARFW